jgi:hypothetical protein
MVTNKRGFATEKKQKRQTHTEREGERKEDIGELT